MKTCFSVLMFSLALVGSEAFASQEQGCAQGDVVLVYAKGITEFSKQHAEVDRVRAELIPFFRDFKPTEPSALADDQAAVSYRGFNPLKWNSDVGVLFAGKLKAERCAVGASVSLRALRDRFDELSRDLGTVEFKFYFGNELQYARKKACSSDYYSYDVDFVPNHEVSDTFLAKCVRPGTYLGSASWPGSGGLAAQVVNPFDTPEKWCHTQADMEAERARLAATCPHVKSVALVSSTITAFRWAEELKIQ
jgi:hypothetical protein